jgi:hypothetical protein
MVGEENLGAYSPSFRFDRKKVPALYNDFGHHVTILPFQRRRYAYFLEVNSRAVLTESPDPGHPQVEIHGLEEMSEVPRCSQLNQLLNMRRPNTFHRVEVLQLDLTRHHHRHHSRYSRTPEDRRIDDGVSIENRVGTIRDCSYRAQLSFRDL